MGIGISDLARIALLDEAAKFVASLHRFVREKVSELDILDTQMSDIRLPPRETFVICEADVGGRRVLRVSPVLAPEASHVSCALLQLFKLHDLLAAVTWRRLGIGAVE